MAQYNKSIIMFDCTYRYDRCAQGHGRGGQEGRLFNSGRSERRQHLYWRGWNTEEIDKVAENAVLRYIAANNIQLNVLSEEIGYVDNGADETLVLDPIDGTTNSIVGIPMYTVSMAIGKSSLNDIHTALIYNLATGEEFMAMKGKGAYQNGKRIHVKRDFVQDKVRMSIYLGRGANPLAFA